MATRAGPLPAVRGRYRARLASGTQKAPVQRIEFEKPFSATGTFDVEILERLLAKADEGRLPPMPRSVA
jgi:hypothetical protein